MGKSVRNMYNAAMSDKLFQLDLKQHKPDYYTGIFMSNNEKVLFASIYMGYLIGKGLYKESDFQ